MLFPLIVLAAVFILIAMRQVAGLRLQIWQIMFLGGLAVMVTGQISLDSALSSINLDVMFFLFGVFIIGEAMCESGYLAHLAYKVFRRAGTVDELVLLLVFGAGLASAFFMNDTLAIVGTPVMILLARRHGIPLKMLLFALAFAVTIGSVLSPIGNPQNLLIAVNGGMPDPFTLFLGHLLLPTLLNLVIAYAFLRLYFGSAFGARRLTHVDGSIADPELARLAKYSLIIMALMILAKIGLVYAGIGSWFRLTYIALAACSPIVAFSRRRLEIVRGIDWQTLVFFTSMFVLMESVWMTGYIQTAINGAGRDITSIPAIFAVSLLLSQVISNVPLVALYLPLIVHEGAKESSLVALAAGSTIAGNLTILGAASNVIIIQNAEDNAGQTITFWEFARIGVPLTIANVLVFWLFLSY